MLQCNLRIQLILLLFCLSQSTIAIAQDELNYKDEKFIVGENWTQNIQTSSKPYVFQSPKYGDFSVNKVNSTNYSLTYNNRGGVLYDTVVLIADKKILSYALKPLFVVVNGETVVGFEGLNSSIPVLDNDESYSNLSIKHLPFKEGLNTSIDKEAVRISNIERGIQYFVYTACDENGQCDEGKVAVFGMDPNWRTARIDWRAYVNEDWTLPLPNDNFRILFSTINGVVIRDKNKLHIPASKASLGDQAIVMIDSKGRQLAYDLTMVDRWDLNTLNQQDRIYLHPSQSAAVNITENDLISDFSTIMTVGQGIQVSKKNNSEVSIQSVGNFKGVSYFDYRTCAYGICDTARVKVYVDDYEPALETFTFNIDASKDYIIPFENPNPDFVLEIVEQGQKGQASILANNSILYSPQQNFSGEDVLRIKYKIKSGGYSFESEHEVVVVGSNLAFDAHCDECVWPGDTDRSNVVDFNDIQAVAKFIGETGAQRNGGVLWKPQYNEAWINQEDSNIQYFDVDGDGIVTSDDVYPILYNYGLYHGLYSAPVVDPSIPIRIEASKSWLRPGDNLELNIFMGDEKTELKGVNGMSVEVDYDKYLVDGEDIKVEKDNSTWLKANEPTIEVVTQSLSENNVVAGQYRVKSLNQDGQGLAMKLSIIVEDEIEGFTTIRSANKELNLIFKNITVHTAGGTITLPEQRLTIPFAPENDVLNVEENEWNLYPNPTSNELAISGKDFQKIEALTIYNIQGKIMNSIEIDYGQDVPMMYLDRLNDGMYILEIRADGKVSRKSFTVVK